MNYTPMDFMRWYRANYMPQATYNELVELNAMRSELQVTLHNKCYTAKSIEKHKRKLSHLLKERNQIKNSCKRAAEKNHKLRLSKKYNDDLIQFAHRKKVCEKLLAYKEKNNLSFRQLEKLIGLPRVWASVWTGEVDSKYFPALEKFALEIGE